jgi:anti-sigma-K factor RskA
MTHEELSQLYELYALGVLDAEENRELEEHLADKCPECVAGVKRARAFNALFTTLPEAVAPPARLRKRVLASVGASSDRNRGWLAAWGLATAALLGAIFFIAAENQRRGQELANAREQIRQSSSELTRVQTALAFLNEPETEQVVFGKNQPRPPRGRVFVNSNRGVLLIASNLPQPAPGRIYEMWLIPKGKGAVPAPAGLFQSDAQGNALYIRSGRVDRANTGAVAVTLEPEAGSSAPTTTPIIVAALSD